ncbi:MAG: hypothetical protein WCK82_14005 [Bacteroidota bacterium]
MPTLLQIGSTSGFNWQSKQIISILYQGVISDWTVIAADGAYWLRTHGEHSLEIERRYELVLQKDGQYELKEIGK